MDKLKEAFARAEKIMLESFETDGNVNSSEAGCARTAKYGVCSIRWQKIDLLRDNWDLFAGDYSCDPAYGFPEEEIKKRVYKDEGILRIVWNKFVKEVDDLMESFIRRDSESWWKCRQFIWEGETEAKYVSAKSFEDIKSVGNLAMNFSDTQMISLSVADWGFIINYLSEGGESMMLCFAKVGSKDIQKEK